MSPPARSPRFLNFLALCAALVVVVSAPACRPTPFVWASDLPKERAAPDPQRATIEPGDGVLVTVTGQPSLSGPLVVGVDGTIALPTVGPVRISGLTREEARVAVTKQLSTILATPQVSLVVESRSIEVSILGEVASPGKFKLSSRDGVPTALALAGGITEFGDEDSVFLIRATEPLRIRFRLKDLVSGGGSVGSFALRDGDLLVVE